MGHLFSHLLLSPHLLPSGQAAGLEGRSIFSSIYEEQLVSQKGTDFGVAHAWVPVSDSSFLAD